MFKTADRYRGTFLFLAGFMFLTPSIGFLFDHRQLNSLGGLSWIPDPVQVWHMGLVLALASLVSSVIGLVSRKLARRCPRVISWGYLAAMVPPVFMVVLSIWAVINGAAPLPWLVNMPMYLTLAAMIYLGSEWPNPPRELTGPTPSLPPTTAPPEVKH